MEQPKPPLAHHISLSGLIIYKDISKKDLFLRAPKYVHKMGISSQSFRMCQHRLNKIKLLRGLAHPRYYGYDDDDYGYDDWPDLDHRIQAFVLRHVKTLKTKISFSTIEKIISKRQRKQGYWVKTLGSANWFEKPKLTHLLTKLNLHTLVFDNFHSSLETEKPQTTIRVIRHLSQIRGPKDLILKDCSLEFLQLINAVLHSFSPEIKISLRKTRWHDDYYDEERTDLKELQQLHNIWDRLTHFKHYSYMHGEADWTSLKSIIMTANKLEHLDLALYSGYCKNYERVFQDAFEDLLITLKAKITLRALKISHSPRQQYLIQPFKRYSQYTDLFYQLQELHLHFPRISFYNLALNKTIQANAISLSGEFVDFLGFKRFLRHIKPSDFQGSHLSLTFQNRENTDVSELLELLATKIMFEKITLKVMHLDTCEYAASLFIFLSKITGPKELKVFLMGKSGLGDWDCDLILQALRESQGQMRKVVFESHCKSKKKSYLKFEKLGNNYKMTTSFCYAGAFYNSGRYYNYYSGCLWCNRNIVDLTELEDEFDDDEEVEISYFDARHRLTERKKKRKTVATYKHGFEQYM